jgi:predicted GH43/DUF377 family glycosyl hydrolase
MKWEKKGLIYSVDRSSNWSYSHSQLPVIHKYSKDIFRIFFSTRDKKNISRIGFIDVDANNPKLILDISKRPILDIGINGTFDDNGVMPSWVISNEDKIYLYYIGWTQKKTVPYQNSIGLAISDDNGNSFQKIQGPIISQSKYDPFFTGTSCVIKENNVWKNWYMSSTGWIKKYDKFEPTYHLKYTESIDGIHWNNSEIVAIDYKNKYEGGICKASVINEKNIYKMWYSYRRKYNYRDNKQNSYKIGYAESKNGINWQRKDSESGIYISKSGWDDLMVAYPHVVKKNKQLLMFYNGNDFGKTGIGYALKTID